MTRIKIDCWWTHTYSITDRIIKQFIFNDDDLENIQFVYDNSYDYLIVFGKPSSYDDLKTKEKIICFTMEPLWSPNNTLNLHEISDYIIVPDKRGYLNSEAYKENLIYMLYGGHGDLNYTDPSYNFDYNNLINKQFVKKYPMSLIVRNSYESHFNMTSDLFEIIYEKRVRISDFLSKNFPEIHVYGNYWEPNNENIFGPICTKMLGLNDYKFSIASENTIQKNYITEKFWDCILTNTIPIYFGCSNFSDYLSELNEFDFTDIINDFNEIKYRIQHIIKNSDLIYKKYVNIIKELKINYFLSKDFNIFRKIKNIIN